MARANENDSNASRLRFLYLVACLVHIIGFLIGIYASPNYRKQPYHNSAFTGEMWVNKLIYGHPRRIRTELGIHLHVFLALEFELRMRCGLGDGREVSFREQLAMFLYMCVTGMNVEHVGERFQRSNDMVCK